MHDCCTFCKLSQDQYTKFVQFNKILHNGLIYSWEARQVRLGKSNASFGRGINVFLSYPCCVLVMAQAITWSFPAQWCTNNSVSLELPRAWGRERESAERGERTERESALLKHNNKEEKEILPFVTQYQPSVSTLKEVLMKNWNLIQNQPLLRQIFKEAPIISYKKGKSLKDMLVRAKI